MSTEQSAGRPASELSDEELEQQGTNAHNTRNWVFLHGTAEQFARHTSRMLELEQEYVRRHPRRTWQGRGGASADPIDEVTALRESLRGIIVQIEGLVRSPRALTSDDVAPAPADPVAAVLAKVAQGPDGRLHKLEVHHAAREAGMERASLAKLYTGDPPLLVADREVRVITDSGRQRLTAEQG